MNCRKYATMKGFQYHSEKMETKAITQLYEQLQKEIKPKGLDFAKELSAECKQATMELSKPKMKMKI